MYYNSNIQQWLLTVSTNKLHACGDETQLSRTTGYTEHVWGLAFRRLADSLLSTPKAISAVNWEEKRRKEKGKQRTYRFFSIHRQFTVIQSMFPHHMNAHTSCVCCKNTRKYICLNIIFGSNSGRFGFADIQPSPRTRTKPTSEQVGYLSSSKFKDNI